jgi:uncharacterized protein (DUF2141 family)
MRRKLIKPLAMSLSIVTLSALAAQSPAIAQSAGAQSLGAQSAATQPANASLSIAFTGLASSQGAIMVALFDSAAAYGGQGAPVRASMAAANGSSVRISFDGLAPGRYAVKAFHDLNGDGKLNANPFGTPTEPYAFSNGAQARMGPPGWDAAAFTVGAGANSQSIVIQ